MIECHKTLDNYVVHDFISNFETIPRINELSAFGVLPCNPKSFLHEKVYNKLNLLGPLSSLVFEMKPNADKGSIHVDIDAKTRIPHWSSLNIILHGQGVMKWFDPPIEGKLTYNSSGKVFYKYWNSNYGDVIDEWHHGKIAIVRTDIPHQVWNYDEEYRLVVSIRWGNRTSWEETKNFFSTLTFD